MIGWFWTKFYFVLGPNIRWAFYRTIGPLVFIMRTKQPTKCLYHVSNRGWGWHCKTSLRPHRNHYWRFQGGGSYVILCCLGFFVSEFWWCFTLCLLAHLSRRLTRWAYSIPVELSSMWMCVWMFTLSNLNISLQPSSRSKPNFIWSIIVVGERLFDQVRSELWFPWQRIAPIVIMGKSLWPL